MSRQRIRSAVPEPFIAVPEIPDPTLVDDEEIADAESADLAANAAALAEPTARRRTFGEIYRAKLAERASEDRTIEVERDLRPTDDEWLTLSPAQQLAVEREILRDSFAEYVDLLRPAGTITRSRPSHVGAFAQVGVGTTAVRILNADADRQSCRLVTITDTLEAAPAVFIGDSSAVSTLNGYPLPSSVASPGLEIPYAGEVWAIATGAAVVGIIGLLE